MELHNVYRIVHLVWVCVNVLNWEVDVFVIDFRSLCNLEIVQNVAGLSFSGTKVWHLPVYYRLNS